MKTWLSLLQGLSVFPLGEEDGDLSSLPNSPYLVHVLQTKYASPHTLILSLFLRKAAFYLFSTDKSPSSCGLPEPLVLLHS